jgi:hypothetical protein
MTDRERIEETIRASPEERCRAARSSKRSGARLKNSGEPMKLIRVLAYAAAFTMILGILGSTYIWLTSSGVATEEYKHAYGVHYKETREPRIFYLTDKQKAQYQTFEGLQNYGLGCTLALADLIWLWKGFNKDGGNA